MTATATAATTNPAANAAATIAALAAAAPAAATAAATTATTTAASAIGELDDFDVHVAPPSVHVASPSVHVASSAFIQLADIKPLYLRIDWIPEMPSRAAIYANPRRQLLHLLPVRDVNISFGRLHLAGLECAEIYAEIYAEIIKLNVFDRSRR